MANRDAILYVYMCVFVYVCMCRLQRTCFSSDRNTISSSNLQESVDRATVASRVAI